MIVSAHRQDYPSATGGASGVDPDRTISEPN